jgi:hypothetical protein
MRWGRNNRIWVLFAGFMGLWLPVSMLICYPQQPIVTNSNYTSDSNPTGARSLVTKADINGMIIKYSYHTATTLADTDDVSGNNVLRLRAGRPRRIATTPAAEIIDGGSHASIQDTLNSTGGQTLRYVLVAASISDSGSHAPTQDSLNHTIDQTEHPTIPAISTLVRFSAKEVVIPQSFEQDDSNRLMALKSDRKSNSLTFAGNFNIATGFMQDDHSVNFSAVAPGWGDLSRQDRMSNGGRSHSSYEVIFWARGEKTLFKVGLFTAGYRDIISTKGCAIGIFGEKEPIVIQFVIADVPQQLNPLLGLLRYLLRQILSLGPCPQSFNAAPAVDCRSTNFTIEPLAEDTNSHITTTHRYFTTLVPRTRRDLNYLLFGGRYHHMGAAREDSSDAPTASRCSSRSIAPAPHT